MLTPPGCFFTGTAAFWATNRVVHKTFLCIKFLLACSKNKLFATIAAGERLI
jgi:hypothetical protein